MPDREQAREAIDALAGIVELLEPLAPAEELEALRRDLAQLRMAFVQSGAGPPRAARAAERSRGPRTTIPARSGRRSGRPGARSSTRRSERARIDRRPHAPARIPRTRRRGGRMAARAADWWGGGEGSARGDARLPLGRGHRRRLDGARLQPRGRARRRSRWCRAWACTRPRSCSSRSSRCSSSRRRSTTSTRPTPTAARRSRGSRARSGRGSAGSPAGPCSRPTSS